MFNLLGSLLRSPEEQLSQAAINGEVETVKDLLERGADPNNLVVDGIHPLALAAQEGHTAVIRVLLDNNKTKINKLTKQGYTALYVATSYNKIECLNELIGRKADCNKTRPGNATPLYRAAAKGHNVCLKVLIDAGADVDTPLERVTPVYMAAQEDHTECVNLLINAKAQLETPSSDGGATALYRAASSGSAKSLAALIKAGANVNAHIEGFSAACIAIQSHHPDCLKELLKAKPIIDSENMNLSPLFVAIDKGRSDCLQLLVDAGADFQTLRFLKVDRQTLHFTPLMYAAKNGQAECVKLLLAAGAKPDAKDQFGTTALHFAIPRGNVDVVNALIRSGAPINSESFGETPLSLAKDLQKPACIEALLKVGASEAETKTKKLFRVLEEGDAAAFTLLLQDGFESDLIDATGSTLALKAVQLGKPQCLAALINAKADLNKKNFDEVSPIYAAASLNIECLRMLIAAGAAVDTDCDGVTPVYIAVQKNRTDCLELLIAAKANVNKPADDGCTPVYKAASEGHPECLRLLIGAGASVNIPLNGVSPLFRAAAMGHAECVQLLIQAKADLEAQYLNMTPLWRAAYNGHTECVRLLLEAGANKNHMDPAGHGPAWAALARGHAECYQLITKWEGENVHVIQRPGVSMQVGASRIHDRPNRPANAPDVTFNMGELFGDPNNPNYPRLTARSVTIVIPSPDAKPPEKLQ